MRLFLIPLALALALAFQAPQVPAGQEPPTPRPGTFEGEDVRAARVRESILGAWQLTRGEIPDLGVAGGGVAGYALFMEGYMSLEIHAYGNTAPDSQNTFFQTGTHRWKLADNGTLETYSLIGTHNITEDEEYDFESPGQRRTYKVRIDNDEMVMEKADRTARMTFKRLGKLRYPDAKENGVDFYGRPIKAQGEVEKQKKN